MSSTISGNERAGIIGLRISDHWQGFEVSARPLEGIGATLCRWSLIYTSPFFSDYENLVFGAMSKVIRRRRTEIEYDLVLNIGVLEYWVERNGIYLYGSR